jgi:arsenate reductase
MSTLWIYHNPACSKSRGAVNLLRERGADFEIREYLGEPLDRAELAALLTRLDAAPAELVRKDSSFEALGLDASDYTTTDSVIALLVAHPKLMQRPIAVRGDRAVIARPSERVLELL